MSSLFRTGKVVGRLVLALTVMSIPVFAAQEHKSEPKAQAHHESKPSHPSSHKAPSHESHASRPSGASHESRPSHPSSASHEGRPSEGRSAGSRPERNVGNREGGNPGRSAGAAGNRGGNVGGNRGEGREGNRGGSMGENRGEAGSHAEPSHAEPGRTVSLRGGGTANLRPNGQIRSISRSGMVIHNNLHGGRTIVSEHNGTRIVGMGGGNGYVQHAYMTRGGVSYYSRTFYSHGVYSTGVYRGYFYHGFQYYGYHPAFWFHPGFYGWAFRPWGLGISWGIGFGGWGWAGAPWFGFYGGYFAPYPVYAAPAFWLTDYLIAADLQAAYAAQAEANASAGGGYDQGPANYPANNPSNYPSNYGDNGGQAANSGQVTLTPEVKQAIADEVKEELAEQQQQAAAESSGNAQAQAAAPASDQVPPALDPAQRTFVVDNTVTATSNGQECELTGGDVITRLTDTPDADNKVTASVQSSKKADCGAGTSVLVSVDDLQEMHNHFEEQLDNGMKELAQKQGTGDMPKAPDTGMTESDIPAPKPDTTAAKDLSDQAAEANQTETEVKQETAAAPAPAPTPAPQ